ncbi:MAG: hypothetical protein RBR26_10575 [Methanosarcina mazei]|nr:hypothetical protein [Methanosarcina mazei]
MIENLTPGSFSTITDYLGFGWCVIQLAWAWLHGLPKNAAIYAVSIFAACLVALNVGGILNETTWSLFGCGVFAIHALYYLKKGPIELVPIMLILLASSIWSVVV